VAGFASLAGAVGCVHAARRLGCGSDADADDLRLDI